jgi:hypothetical protein
MSSLHCVCRNPETGPYIVLPNVYSFRRYFPKLHRRGSSFITTYRLDAYLGPVFGHWCLSETIGHLGLREAAMWSIPYVSHYANVIPTHIKLQKFRPCGIIQPVAWIIQVFCQTVFIMVYGNWFLVCVVDSRCLAQAGLPIAHSLHIPVIIVALKCSHNL